MAGPASLQHELFEVVVQDGVLDVAKDQANVLRVNGGGEVVVEGLLLLVSALVPETIHQELLHVVQAVRIPCVLGEIVLDGHRSDLLLQQVCLVEEEDDGHVAEDAVVDDGLKDVERLHEAVGLPVLHQHLVELAGRDEEEDRGDAVKALEPPAALRPLAAHVHHLEGHILDLKVVLVNALGGLTCQQDVLLCW